VLMPAIITPEGRRDVANTEHDRHRPRTGNPAESFTQPFLLHSLSQSPGLAKTDSLRLLKALTRTAIERAVTKLLRIAYLTLKSSSLLEEHFHTTLHYIIIMSETGHWNAMRFAQSPLPQPSYNFAHVPKSERDLKGSSLQRVDDRENLKTCMAEMLLLCKEAMRRRPGKGNGSKPLSLEYLADRLDVDDPCFGYMVRTNENLNKGHVHWEKGMLQGTFL
jgi:hypothetical protein